MSLDIRLVEMNGVREIFASISRGTVYSWMNETSPSYIPSFPKPFKIGGKNYWKVKDIESFIASYEEEAANELH